MHAPDKFSSGSQKFIDSPNNEPAPQQRDLESRQTLDLDAALKRFGEKGTKTVLRLFLDDVRTRFGNIEQAIEANNLCELANLSHSLMGASAIIQAKRLKVLSGELEMAARNGQVDEVRRLFKAQMAEHELLKKVATPLLETEL